VAFYCFIFGYPLTTLFSFAFIAGFVFRLIVRRCFGAVLISVLPVVGQLCMNLNLNNNTNITPTLHLFGSSHLQEFYSHLAGVTIQF